MAHKKVSNQRSNLPSNAALMTLFVGIALLTHLSVRLHAEHEQAYWQCKVKSIFSRFNPKNLKAVTTHQAPVKILSEDPPIRLYPHFLSHKESKQLIALAKNRLKGSKVIRGNKAVLDQDTRSSTTAYLQRSDGRIVRHIEERVCKIVSCETHQIEPLQVVHYSKGQRYKPHYDFFDPGDFNPQQGQRQHTFLIYLNDLASGDGGLTFFPRLNIRVQPKTGTALYFRDLDTNGNPDPRTLHAGEEILKPSVEKWAINVWIREKTFSHSR